MKYHLIPVRKTIIKKSTNNKCWRGCGEKGTLLHCWWKCKLVQSLWKTVWRFCRKLKIELPMIQQIPLLSIYPDKNIFQKDTYTPMFITALFPIAKTHVLSPSVLSDSLPIHRNNLNVHQPMNGQRCGAYIQRNTTQP